MTPSFAAALSTAIERQYMTFEPYRTLCELQDIELSDLQAFVAASEFWRIPAIPADWFKREKSQGLFRQLSHPAGDGAWLLSSSTSGDHSYTWRTPADIDAIQRSFAGMWGSINVETALFFAPEPDLLARSGAPHAIDDKPTWPYATVPLRQAPRHYGRLTWLVQPRVADAAGNGRAGLEVQYDQLCAQLDRAESEGTSIGLCMSVLMLYPAVRSLPRTYHLGENAYILTGAGGWDGKKGTAVGEPIHKPTYVREVAEQLGIPESAWETHIRDGYGTTENGKAQLGTYSRTFEDFVYHVGDDVRLYVIDPVTEHPAGVGGRGYPRFVSPVGVEGFAGVCVQQQDLVTVVDAAADGSVSAFTHIARSAGTEGAGGVGCALEMAEEVRM